MRKLFIAILVCFTAAWAMAQDVDVYLQSGRGSGGYIVISPDGKWILSDGQIWDAQTGREFRLLSNNARKCDWSPNGKDCLIAVDNAITIWEAETGKRIKTLRGQSNVGDAVFSPDGKYIVAGYNDMNIKIWDVESGKELKTIASGQDYLTKVIYSPDGKRIASGNSSGKDCVKIWDVDSGRELLNLFSSSGTSVTYSPDSKKIISKTGKKDENIIIVDAATGREIRTIAGFKNFICALAVSPDGRMIIAGDRDGVAKIWELETGKEIRTISLPSNLSSDYVSGITYFPDGKKIALTYGDGVIRVIDAESGRELLNLAQLPYINAVAFSPNGKRVITVDFNNVIKYWDADTGRFLQLIKPESRPYFSPNGRYFVTASRNAQTESGYINLFDAETGKHIRSWQNRLRYGNDSFVWSSDSTKLASMLSTFRSSVCVWSVETGQNIAVINNEFIPELMSDYGVIINPNFIHFGFL